jgi:hypothetical protein
VLAEVGAVMATVGACVSAVEPEPTTMLFDVVAVNDGAEKLSVRVPAEPLIERFVKPAIPLALVVAVTVPPSVPPPDPIDAVMTTPAWLMKLLDASRSRTAGCVAKGTPASADVDGCAAMISAVVGVGAVEYVTVRVAVLVLFAASRAVTVMTLSPV